MYSLFIVLMLNTFDLIEKNCLNRSGGQNNHNKMRF